MKKRTIYLVGIALFIGTAATVYAATSLDSVNCTVKKADGMNITLDCEKNGKRILTDKPANIKKACTVKEVKKNLVTLDCSNLVKVAHQITLRAKVTKKLEGC